MDNTYALTHVVGSSKTGIDDAIRNAVRTASRTLRHVEWFKVTDIQGHLVDGDISHFQVSVEIGFRYEEGEGPRA